MLPSLQAGEFTLGGASRRCGFHKRVAGPPLGSILS